MKIGHKLIATGNDKWRYHQNGSGDIISYKLPRELCNGSSL